MTELELSSPAGEIVIDLNRVEEYVRGAQLALVNAVAYVVLISAYGVLRVVLDVPYLRAAIGLYVVVALVTIPLKRRVLARVGRRTGWLAASTVAGLAVTLLVLLTLVELNRGTLFAEAAAALVGAVVVHVVDRIALARA